jgi:ribonuclease Z
LQAALTILGCGSATPLKHRHHSAQILDLGGFKFLLDCGEGTQWQLIRHSIKYQKIDAIFITHLHGDHYLGLMGLLNTMSLNGRSKPLDVISPPGLKRIFHLHMELSAAHDDFPIHWIETDTETSTQVWGNQHVQVTSLPLKHRIACNGYLFQYREKILHLQPEKCKEHEIPQKYYHQLVAGEDIQDANLGTLRSSDFTREEDRNFSYAYVTDSLPLQEVVRMIKGVDVLFHEATFLNNLADRALQTYHSTALQAAGIAKKAGVKVLIIGHFSSRYHQLEAHLAEAQVIFPETKLAEEGALFEFKYH